MADKLQIHGDAIIRFEEALTADQDNREAAYADLAFLTGGLNQWDPATIAAYRTERRPLITINRLPQFVQQVANDIRRQRPGIKVLPVDDDGDPDEAEVIEGMIRYIEAKSDAQLAYAAMADSQVACGMGHVRVAVEYCDNRSLNQEIRILPVRDQLGVIWDPNAVLPTRADAMYCFEPFDMSEEAFKEMYPDHSADSMPSKSGASAGSLWWTTSDRLMLARYWVREEKRKWISATDGGDVAEDDTEEESMKRDARRRRVIKSYGVKCYTMTGSAIVGKEEKSAGQYIPIIPCVGTEIALERATVRKGLIRDAKDPQKLMNFARSNMAEMYGMQPKAPWLANADAIKRYAGDWREANKRNLPYLLWDVVPGAPNGGMPQRADPPRLPDSAIAMAQVADSDLKGTTGIYDASLGARSNETSGRAILAREKQGDTATFHFADNHARSIARVGEVVLDMIPHVYDTKRIVRIMGPDSVSKVVKANDKSEPYVNPKTGKKRELRLFESAGKYDVIIDSGPTLATQREEVREMLTAFVQATPAAAPIIVPRIARLMNLPDADEMAEELVLLLPPEIRQELEARRAKRNPEAQPEQQVGPDGQPVVPPAEQAAMAAQQQQAQMLEQQQQMQAQAQEAQIAEAAAKLQLEKQKAAGQLEKDAAQAEVAHATATASILNSLAQMRIAMAQTPAANVDNVLIGMVHIAEQMLGIEPLPIEAEPIADPAPPLVPEMPPDDGGAPPMPDGGMPPPDAPPVPMGGPGGVTLQ